MVKEMPLQIINKMNNNIKNRIFICICINILLLIVLYIIPIEGEHSICIYKNITGNECFNCGMTRAFLSVLHMDFKVAIEYNWRVIIVFPYVTVAYIIMWTKYILKGGKRNARKT